MFACTADLLYSNMKMSLIVLSDDGLFPSRSQRKDKTLDASLESASRHFKIIKKGHMNSANHPWELIYQKDGRVFAEPIPDFMTIVQEFSRQGCQRILDLGCGNGRHVLALQKLGFNTTGLDISISGLRLTSEWVGAEGKQAGLVEADMRRPLPFRSGSFDGLLSTQVIHHALLAEVRTAISEIWRVLCRGGLAFVTLAGMMDEDKKYEEIENGTFIPLEGSEKGLPHHIFAEQELASEFSAFQIREISRRAEGKVLAAWLVKDQVQESDTLAPVPR